MRKTILFLLGMFVVGRVFSQSADRVIMTVARRTVLVTACEPLKNKVITATASHECQWYSGSGVLLGGRLALSALHVVAGKREIAVNDIPAAIVRENQKRDIVLLRLKRPIRKNPSPVVLAIWRTEEEVFLVGEPDGAPILSRGKVVGEKLPTFDPKMEGLLLKTTASVADGWSGGGCWSLNGRLLGVVVAYDDFGGSSLIIPAEEIRKLLH